MVESFDIQNLLQTGYFATSRAKTPREPSPDFSISRYSLPPPPPHESPVSRHSQALTRHRRFNPPPPSVEDEEVSLKREHGTTPSIKSSDDDTPSRGEVEQNPIIIEVHEHNPERRFVILTGPPESDDGEHEKGPEPRSAHGQKRSENNTYETSNHRQYEPSLKPESTSKPSSSTGSDSDKPRLEKRKSRQDLPRLETEFRDDHLPEKYRNYPPVNNSSRFESTRPDSNRFQSSRPESIRPESSRSESIRLEGNRFEGNRPEGSRFEGSRPESSRPEGSRPENNRPGSSRTDNPPPRPPRPNLDPALNPEITKHGSSGREKAYHDSSQTQSGSHQSPTQRSRSTQPDDRRFDEGHTRASSASSVNKRATPNLDSGKSTRPSSNDRVSDARYRTEYPPPRPSRMERSPEYGRPERDEPPKPSKHQSRESESRLAEDHPKGPRELQPRRRKSIVHQDGRESLPALEKVEAPSGPRLRPKGPNVPLSASVVSVFMDDVSNSTRGSSTFPISKEEKAPTPPERPKNQPPYPDDDHSLDPFDIRKKEWSGRSVYGEDPSISMPDIPLPISIGPETPLETRPASIPPPGIRIPPAGTIWQPLVFEPERDGCRLERPVGTVRRYSESGQVAGAPKFPDCRRKHPVVGKMDWLTLTRSDLNICPDCYGEVFANTEFRTAFQPMLRSSDRAISCDFGLSPWYRIAWLLTLKHNKQDLRMFYDVANVISATHNTPCPGDRTTSRNWMAIWNPYSRRLISDFSVCPQCARVIEALLPNLTGIFVPLDPRSEPTRGTCSMRYKDKRKRFVAYFDAMETISDLARTEREEPDLHMLANELEKMTAISECHEDTPVGNGSWHMMQFLPRFTVCGDCFEEVVRPRLNDDNVIARDFYKKPERLPVATCQLYSLRMREIFQKACRWNDPKYLEDKVLERMDIEADIHDKLRKLAKSKDCDEINCLKVKRDYLQVKVLQLETPIRWSRPLRIEKIHEYTSLSNNSTFGHSERQEYFIRCLYVLWLEI